MSTIPEAMVANALGMRVIAFSCISNKAAGISEEKLSHEEVTENTAASLPTMQSLITHLLSELN
jgi:purine-nucleoside phosphorylase